MIGMKSNGIGRMSAIVAGGLAVSAAAEGIRVYLVRELVIEFLLFCILFASIGIVVAILLVIGEVAFRTFLRLRAQVVWTHLHLCHANAARAATTSIHKNLG
jgi:hypothetical protein